MDNFNLAAALKAHREENGYSIRDMADKLHMSKSAYDRLEKGLTKPTYDQIPRIVKLLDLNIDAIKYLDTTTRPMAPIPYLKRGLLYGSLSAIDALNCLKDLAEAIECQPLFEWAELETKGYSRNKDRLPSYRLRGINYEFEYEQNGMPRDIIIVPTELVDPHGDHPLWFAYCSEIGELNEIWPAWDGKSYGFDDRLLSTLEPIIQEVYGPDMKVTQVMRSVTHRFQRKLALAVQEVMLNFLLDLEAEFGQNARISDFKMHKRLVVILFQKALKSIGRADHLDLPVKFKAPENIILVKGDDDAFCRWLYRHDIWDDEMDEFLELLDVFDATPPPKGIVPPEMRAWAKKITATNPRFGEKGEKLMNGLKVFYGVEE